MRFLPFFAPYLIPLSVVACYLRGGMWAFGVVSWIYLAIPWLDSMLGRDELPSAAGTPWKWHEIWLCRLALWLWVPTHMGLVLWALAVAEREHLGWFQCWTIACSLGFTGGIIGITVAHELVHSRSLVERWLAELLMSVFSYPHFCLEHVHGHHRWVATPHDPATAREGENLYAFLFRCIPGGWLSAWRWETQRLHKLNKPVWDIGNRLVRYAIQVIVLYWGVYLVFGVRGLFVFAAQGMVSVFLLEAINYVQHYGLLRKELLPGHFEPVQPWHAWNFSHRLSNALVFNLGRHSDHHCGAQRPFHDLEHRHDGPQLPAGYAAMVVLALFPPLWHCVMDARVGRWREKHDCET